MTEAVGRYRGALVALTSLFFMWGLITSLNDILIPHMKAAFALTYVEAMLIQFCFFGAYFIVSLPSGVLVERIGYKSGIVVGLIVAGIGCLMFYPAADARSYVFFLAAFFVLASGITLLQVAANPYVAILGEPRTASSRLNLTQAFNSLGTTIGPYMGAVLILAAPVAMQTTPELKAAAEAQAVQGPYIGLAATLFLIALVIGQTGLPRIASEESAGHDVRSVWSHRPLMLGAIGIFVYVGAEVSIGSFLVDFMKDPDIAGLPAATAGKYVALYWGGAMVGRFIGSAVMTRVAPGKVLAFNATVAVVLLSIALAFSGTVAMGSVLAIGLCNSIMFPTIFTLAIAGLGKRTGEGSGVLCMAIVGGAVMPLAQGWVADHGPLLYSYIVPLICYVYVVHYGYSGHRPVPARETALEQPRAM